MRTNAPISSCEVEQENVRVDFDKKSGKLTFTTHDMETFKPDKSVMFEVKAFYGVQHSRIYIKIYLKNPCYDTQLMID